MLQKFAIRKYHSPLPSYYVFIISWSVDIPLFCCPFFHQEIKETFRYVSCLLLDFGANIIACCLCTKTFPWFLNLFFYPWSFCTSIQILQFRCDASLQCHLLLESFKGSLKHFCNQALISLWTTQFTIYETQSCHFIQDEDNVCLYLYKV